MGRPLAPPQPSCDTPIPSNSGLIPLFHQGRHPTSCPTWPPHLADFPEFGSSNGCCKAGGPCSPTTGALCCGERGCRGRASPCSVPCS